MDEKSIWLDYISELKNFEHNLNEDSIDEFEKWRNNLVDKLTSGQKIRFTKLRFYTVSSIEEIPF